MSTSPLLALMLGLGCADGLPWQTDADRYVAEVRPLMLENGQLSDRLLETASEAHAGELEPEEAQRVLREELVPLAEHLHLQAEQVAAPSDWRESHRELVRIWRWRAEAWYDLSEAVELGDVDLWKQARDKSDQAKLQEEQWFNDVNAQLGAGRRLHQFP